MSETALGLLVHDGGVITPPSPILCAVRIGMRVETCAAAAFSISQTGSKRGTASDDVVAHRQGLLTLPLSGLSGMLDSRTAAAQPHWPVAIRLRGTLSGAPPQAPSAFPQ